MRFGLEDLDVETSAGQTAGKLRFIDGRPESDAPTRLKSAGDKTETTAVIDPRIFRLHKRRRAVINVQENRVVTAVIGTADHFEDVGDENFNAGVVEERAVYALEKVPIPGDDLAE
jgi:hypothetical protein